MRNIWTDKLQKRRGDHNERVTERRALAVPARLTWKDSRGATRFASAVTRDISDFGVYVECYTPVSIPLYRLVQLQLDRNGSVSGVLPSALQQGRVLSAVYRVSPPSSSERQGFALRLMVDPRRARVVEQSRATA